jgi:SPP1 family predicted phage head-tail adaptor
MPLIADGAGELRGRARFSRPNSVEDEYGNVSTGWEDMFTVSANFTPRLGGESVEAARLEGRQPVIVRVRYSPDTKLIRTDWRATNVDSGIVYNIRSVVDPNMGNPQHGKWIEALAEAGVAI